MRLLCSCWTGQPGPIALGWHTVVPGSLGVVYNAGAGKRIGAWGTTASGTASGVRVTPLKVHPTLESMVSPPLNGDHASLPVERRGYLTAREYLLQLGADDASVTAICTKRSELAKSPVSDNLRSLLEFLTDEIGLDTQQWVRVLLRDTKVLDYNVERVLAPTAAWFVAPSPDQRTEADEEGRSSVTAECPGGLGLTRQGRAQMVASNAAVLWKKVGTKLRPMADYYLRDLGLTYPELRQMLVRSPQLLSMSLENNVKPTVRFLRGSLGMPEARLRWVLVNHPAVMTYSVSKNLRPKAALFCKELDGQPEEVSELIGACPQVLKASLTLRILPRVAQIRAAGLIPSLRHARPICMYPDAKFQRWLEGGGAAQVPARLIPRPRLLEVVSTTELGLMYTAPGGQAGPLLYPGRNDGRQQVRATSIGLHVLDLCCYTGSFALNAAAGNASIVVGVDSSTAAIRAARTNAKANCLASKVKFVKSPMGTFCKDQDLMYKWDLVVLDPPLKIRERPRPSDIRRAQNTYTDRVLQALPMVREGGSILCIAEAILFEEWEDFVVATHTAAASTGVNLTPAHYMAPVLSDAGSTKLAVPLTVSMDATSSEESQPPPKLQHQLSSSKAPTQYAAASHTSPKGPEHVDSPLVKPPHGCLFLVSRQHSSTLAAAGPDVREYASRFRRAYKSIYPT